MITLADVERMIVEDDESGSFVKKDWPAVFQMMGMEVGVTDILTQRVVPHLLNEISEKPGWEAPKIICEWAAALLVFGVRIGREFPYRRGGE